MKWFKSLFVVIASIGFVSAAGFSPAVAEAKLKSDFVAYITNPATLPTIGDSTPWAGGIILRKPNRSLYYISSENGYAEFNLSGLTADPASLMTVGGYGVKRQWANDYGVDTSRMAGVQAINQSAWLFVVSHPGSPNASIGLGGNGSVTATLRYDANGLPSTVTYDGKTVSVTDFQSTNWFHSLTGLP